jgi:hypothetical protein
MSTRKKLFIVTGIVGLVLIMGVGIFTIYRFFNPYLDREVSGPITISNEWMEITPKEPLRAERQIQFLVLDLDKSIRAERDGWGLVLPNGSITTPEVQLIDKDGIIYGLTQPSVWLSPSTGVTLRQFSSPDLPKDKVYRAVRIRSNKPVRCDRIFWRSYNQWDVS